MPAADMPAADMPAADMPEPQPAVHTVQLNPTGFSFPARADQPLLRSAEDAGIDLPSSCRNGSCRTCMQQLAQGQVHYAIEWPGLLAEEKVEGWILPCVAYPDSDLLLQVQGDQVLPVG